MAKKKAQIIVNNIQTRLEDAKRQYQDNQNMIAQLKKYIDSCESLSVRASNGTVSIVPEFKQWQDLIKTNITIRKQINDMEILISDGKVKDEQESNPFD